MPNLNQLLHIDKLLRNASASQLGIGKSAANTLYSKTTKPENLFDEKGAHSLTKQAYAFKNYAYTYIVRILNFFSREL